MARVLQLIQADGNRSHRGAVIQRVPGERLTGKVYWLGGEGHQVAGAHQGAGFGGRQPGIDEQVLQAHWLAFLRGGQERIWRLDDNRRQRTELAIFGNMHHHWGVGQDARVDPANLGDAQETVWRDLGHHQPNRIHVRGKQDARAGVRASAAFDPVQAAGAADFQLVHQRAPGIRDDLAYGILKGRKPGKRYKLFQKRFQFHMGCTSS